MGARCFDSCQLELYDVGNTVQRICWPFMGKDHSTSFTAPCVSGLYNTDT